MNRSIVTFRPFEDMERFGEFFDRLMGASLPVRSNSAVQALPVDIFEQENALVFRAAVPGVNPEELEITIENNVLTFKGEVKQPELGENDKVYRRENAFGTFTRSLRLPENLDTEKVAASFAHGMVTVTFPRLIEVKPEPIRVPIQIVP